MGHREDDKVAERRRGFLKALGLGATAAAAAAAPGAALAQGAGQRPPKENEQQRVAARYRETDHVRAFYRTNRYEQ